MQPQGNTPITATRVPPELLKDARARNPELQGMTDAPLLRFALGILAALAVRSVLSDDEIQRLIKLYGPQRSGRKTTKPAAGSTV